MSSLVFIYFSILSHVILNVYSQGSPGNVLGPSGCDVSTQMKSLCGTPDIPIESLPKECTSYLYCCIQSSDNTISDLRQQDQSIKGYLDALIHTHTSVIIYFTHPSSKDWCDLIQPNNTAGQTADINNLKKFLDEHKGIKGIILGNLLMLGGSPIECPDYSKNLKSYIDLMKKTIMEMPIGIVVSAKVEKDNYKNPKLQWFDFTILDPSVDLYVFSVFGLNQCSDAFLKTGVFPLTGNSDYTVDKCRILMQDGGASPSKIYYRFYVFTQPMNQSRDMCEAYPTSYCKNVKNAKTTLCGDTLQTFVEKGAYAKVHGSGFIVSNVENDDTSCICQCDQSYPAFKALLSGYHGTPAPAPCALFDRT